MDGEQEEWARLLKVLNATLVDELFKATYESAEMAVAQATAAIFMYAASVYQLDSWQYAHAQAYFLCLIHDDLQNLFCIHANDVLVPGGVKKDFERLDEWFSQLEKTVMPERARDLLAVYGEIADKETLEHWKMLAGQGEPNGNSES